MRCQSPVRTPGYRPAGGAFGGPVPLEAEWQTTTCGHEFQDGTATANAGLCACGLYALGRCRQCDAPLCRQHTVQVDGVVYCADDAASLRLQKWQEVAAQVRARILEQVGRGVSDFDRQMRFLGVWAAEYHRLADGLPDEVKSGLRDLYEELFPTHPAFSWSMETWGPAVWKSNVEPFMTSLLAEPAYQRYLTTVPVTKRVKTLVYRNWKDKKVGESKILVCKSDSRYDADLNRTISSIETLNAYGHYVTHTAMPTTGLNETYADGIAMYHTFSVVWALDLVL